MYVYTFLRYVYIFYIIYMSHLIKNIYLLWNILLYYASRWIKTRKTNSARAHPRIIFRAYPPPRYLAHVKTHLVHIGISTNVQRDKNTRPFSPRWPFGDHLRRGTHDRTRGCGERVWCILGDTPPHTILRGLFSRIRAKGYNDRCVEIIAMLRLTIANLHAWPRSTLRGGPRL